jgi:hypothetical protein
VEDGDAKAHVSAHGHMYAKGQACEYRRDTFTAVADTTADLTIEINMDIANVLSLPPGVSLPNISNIPGAPGGAGSPNVPLPDFGGPNGYQMIIKVTSVKGTDEWEESTASGIPPKCTVTRGTKDWSFAPAFGLYQKQLDPNDPDHLKDSDSSSNGRDEMRVTWDLTR